MTVTEAELRAVRRMAPAADVARLDRMRELSGLSEEGTVVLSLCAEYLRALSDPAERRRVVALLLATEARVK